MNSLEAKPNCLIGRSAKDWIISNQQEITQCAGKFSVAIENLMNSLDAEGLFIAYHLDKLGVSCFYFGTLNDVTIIAEWLVVRADSTQQGLGRNLHDFTLYKLSEYGAKCICQAALTDAGFVFAEKLGFKNVGGNNFYLEL